MLDALTISELDSLFSQLSLDRNLSYDDRPNYWRDKSKQVNVDSILDWTARHKGAKGISVMIERLEAATKKKAAYPVKGAVPGTHYITWDEFTRLPSYKFISNAVTYCHDYRRKCSPKTNDGYVSVDAIYNISAWANWKSSSLGAGEKAVADQINALPLGQLMELNHGRRMNQPALFPEKLLPLRPATVEKPENYDAAMWWNSLLTVEKDQTLIAIKEPVFYAHYSYRDLPRNIQEEIAGYLARISGNQAFYMGDWKPGDYALYTDFGFRSMIIVQVLPRQGDVLDQVSEMLEDGGDDNPEFVKVKVVDTSLLNWDFSNSYDSGYWALDKKHTINYTNLYRNVYDVLKHKRYVYPWINQKNLSDLQAHPGWETLKKYGLVNEREENRRKAQERKTLWERAMFLLQKKGIRNKATHDEWTEITGFANTYGGGEGNVPMEVLEQMRRDLETYPLFDAIAMWVQPVENALAANYPRLQQIAEYVVEKYEERYLTKTTLLPDSAEVPWPPTLKGGQRKHVVMQLNDPERITIDTSKMYHATPRVNVKSILKTGLKGDRLFVAVSPEAAQMFAGMAKEGGYHETKEWAILEIAYNDGFPHDLEMDLMFEPFEGFFVDKPAVIPPGHIKLFAEYQPQTKPSESETNRYDIILKDLARFEQSKKREPTLQEWSDIIEKHSPTIDDWDAFTDYLGTYAGRMHHVRILGRLPDQGHGHHRYWVEIGDTGDTSFTKGSLIPYEQFEAEDKVVRARGGKPASIVFRGKLEEFDKGGAFIPKYLPKVTHDPYRFAKSVLESNTFTEGEVPVYSGETGINPNGVKDEVWRKVIADVGGEFVKIGDLYTFSSAEIDHDPALAPATIPKETIEGDLKESIKEEFAADEAYRGRRSFAESHGDEETAKLYDHITKEEIAHAKEFVAREKEVKKARLDFMADSPEYLASTWAAADWREKLDQEFRTAIARARGK